MLNEQQNATDEIHENVADTKVSVVTVQQQIYSLLSVSPYPPLSRSRTGTSDDNVTDVIYKEHVKIIFLCTSITIKPAYLSPYFLPPTQTSYLRCSKLSPTPLICIGGRSVGECVTERMKNGSVFC